MRAAFATMALMLACADTAVGQEQPARLPMFGPNAKRAPTTQRDVDRDYVAALECSSKIAAVQARISTKGREEISAAAWESCKPLWGSAGLTFGAYAEPYAPRSRSWDETFARLDTSLAGLRRRWNAEADRIVARVRSEGPRL